MELEVERQVNGDENISMRIVAHYTPEEFEALTATKGWALPCISSIYAERGLWRDAARIRQPTFHQLYDPGILIEGFTQLYADSFEKNFESSHGRHIKKTLAPVLQLFRRVEHKKLEQERDTYFGARPQLPYQNPRRLLPPEC